ncbi:SRPBCC family protein [Polynucleobacter sp. AP-Nino-20-G2]|uniref:SRPBCC family protein n=1 Tax=Polynucleobacter sp. AP-Nino-20-G2 TaxID=2576917 RepID=UPI001BFD3D35|nr:SRPBCC family protein [Polynucleobacter sp. AP-Nino-20-G2]QWE16641.1 SRPBCC family protein [Polynucleobacter sp. AP-Nino-20-G2]
MKIALGSAVFFLSLISGVLAQETATPIDLRLLVARNGDRFQINASYEAPINACEAFAFITDYEGAKYLPGIVDSKVVSRSGNKARVTRLLEERILFIPFEMRSELEYTEVPNKTLHFEQLSGDTKYYKGSWRLIPDKGFTTFVYDGQVEPNSLIPSVVIEYFIKNILRRQFEAMAEMASQRKSLTRLSCK